MTGNIRQRIYQSIYCLIKWNWRLSYRIHIEDQLLHLQYIGHVNGLQVVQVINDERFLPNLQKSKYAFFDFSAAQEVDLSFDEVKSFGTVGKVEATFIEDLHVVIILSNESGRERAEYYVDSIGSKNWQFDIVSTIEEARIAVNKPV